MYDWLRAALLHLPPESAHGIALETARLAEQTGVLQRLPAPPPGEPVAVMGLTLPSAVGLAAGLDKNGRYIDAMAALGFGFVEVGTVTPRPQPGNPRPRLFRLPEYEAIINRMGFNNRGLARLVANVRGSRHDGILGVNVGKNLDTPVESAVGDYLAGIERVWPLADYITINVSSPNTPGLRDLQFGRSLRHLLDAVKSRQSSLARSRGHYVPIAVKVAPDINDAAIRFMATTLLDSGLDAVIATNTTLDHLSVVRHPLGDEKGGLSGRPLARRSREVIEAFSAELDDALPIIGVGGIVDGDTAAEKLRAGASAVQLYSGLIFRGPGLIGEATEAVNAVIRERKRSGPAVHEPGKGRVVP